MWAWNSGGPDLGVFLFDSIDQVDPEIQMDRLVPQNVLELLADPHHFVLAQERKDHREAAVEEDPFHDDVEADQVLEEFLDACIGGGGKCGVQNVLRQLHLELVFVVDRVDLVVHVEYLALVEGQRFDDVEERVGVERLFERLAQEVLAHFGVGHVAEDRQDDVIADQALGRREEAEVAHDDAPLVIAQRFRLPDLDVFAHRHFVRHPVVGAAVQIVLPRPLILQGHQLVDIHRVAVDQPLLSDLDPFIDRFVFYHAFLIYL